MTLVQYSKTHIIIIMMCDFEYCTNLGPTPKMGGRGRATVNLQVKQLRKMQYDQQKTNAHNGK